MFFFTDLLSNLFKLVDYYFELHIFPEISNMQPKKVFFQTNITFSESPIIQTLVDEQSLKRNLNLITGIFLFIATTLFVCKFQFGPSYLWTTKEWVLPYWHISDFCSSNTDSGIFSFWSMDLFTNSNINDKLADLNGHIYRHNPTDIWFRHVEFDRNTSFGSFRLQMWVDTGDPYWRGLASVAGWHVRYHPDLIKGLLERLVT